jgi:hypothetical protein
MNTFGISSKQRLRLCDTCLAKMMGFGDLPRLHPLVPLFMGQCQGGQLAL